MHTSVVIGTSGIVRRGSRAGSSRAAPSEI